MMNGQEGLVSDVRYRTMGAGKVCEVKVVVGAVDGGRTTDWLTKLATVSSFYKEHNPVSVGDQVIVYNLEGEHEDGYVGDYITHEAVTLPAEANENNLIRWVKDGTTYIHNIQTKEISLNTPCAVVMNCDGEATIKAPSITLDGEVRITKNLVVDKKISDVLGTVTDHQHAVKEHNTAVPR